jgi:hypothetical protein
MQATGANTFQKITVIRTFVCKRPIKMSPLCQLAMTLPRKAARPLADRAGTARITAPTPLRARSGKGRKGPMAPAQPPARPANTRGARSEHKAPLYVTAGEVIGPR